MFPSPMPMPVPAAKVPCLSNQQRLMGADLTSSSWAVPVWDRCNVTVHFPPSFIVDGNKLDNIVKQVELFLQEDDDDKR